MHSAASKDRPSSASYGRTTIPSGKSSFLERNNNNNDILSSTAFHSTMKHDSTTRVPPQKDSAKVDSLPPSGSARSVSKNSVVRTGIEMREKTAGRQEQQRSVVSSSLEIKLSGPMVNTDPGRRVSSGVEMMSRFAPRPYRPASADSKVIRTRSQSVEVHTLSGSRSGVSAGVEGQSSPRGRVGVVADDSKVGQLARNYSPAAAVREPIKTNVTLSSSKSPVSKVSLSSNSGASTTATGVVARQNKDVPLVNNLVQNTSSLHHGSSQVKGENLVKSNGKVSTASTMNSVNCARTTAAGISLASGPKMSSAVTTSSSIKSGGLTTSSAPPPPRQSNSLPPQQTNSQTVTMAVSLKANPASSSLPSKMTNDKKTSSSSSSPAASANNSSGTIPPNATTTKSLGDTTRTTTVHSTPAVSSKESTSSGQTMKSNDALLKGHPRDASLLPSEILTKPSTSSNDKGGSSSSTGGGTIKHRAVIKSGPESLLFPTSCPGPTMASQKSTKDSISTVRDNSVGLTNKTMTDGATVKTPAALENTTISASHRAASSLSSTTSAASIASANKPKQVDNETNRSSLASPPSSTQTSSSSSKSSLSSSPSNTLLNSSSSVASSTPTSSASPNGCDYEPESPVSPTDSLIIIDSPVALPLDPQRKLNTPTGLRLSTKIDTSNDSVSSALSVLMKRQSVSGSMVPASPKCSYRYGSRGAISSIYQNKLGSGASSQYNKNMTDLYGDFFRNMKDCRSVVKDDVGDVVAPDLEARSQQGQASTLKTFPVGPDSGKTFEVKPVTKDDSSLPVAHGDQVSLNLYLCPTSERRSRCNAPQPIRRVLSCDSASTSSSSSSSSSSQVKGRSPSLTASSETRRLFFEGGSSSEAVKPPDEVQLNGVVDRSPSPGTAYDPPLGGQTSYIDDPGVDGAGGNGVVVLGVVATGREAPKRRSKRKQRVTFEPVSLLLNVALEGELDLVKVTIPKVRDAMVSNESGVTALHNSVFSGHHDVCRFLIDYGCTVNITDADGWTPLHCAASCNNVEMVKLLVQNGACLFAMTFNDRQIPVEKCNRQLGGYDDCIKYLSEQSQAIGVANGGVVYATSDYNATGTDELSFRETDQLRVVRKGDDAEMEWWWAKPVNQPSTTKQGYVPRNYLSMYPAKPKLTVKKN